MAQPGNAQLLKFLHHGAAATAQPAAPAAAPAPVRNAAIAPGKFDFYVLSLSWSPGFCESNPSGKGRKQCAVGAHLGFVLHGLWPQNERGYPSRCGGSQSVSKAALDETVGVYPARGLARYEWRKHGTCTGLSPTAYFAAAAQAFHAVTIPDAFKAPAASQTMAPVAIMRAFTKANPGIRPGMMAVACRKGVLQEVRLCLTKDLRSYRACRQVMQHSCHAASINIPAER
ncbi:MAG: ribonuclease T [Hyphomicrobiales bacterium]|nr:ribonuclease T [Hyphomicrobiales bacterium]